ncbi:MAG: hypothetical protein EA426_09570 [Spirochaetaceae bacterium]|nr:MAG: hypothetical protein EA426_09570 [Spirochaetaceae bacterium]
MRVRAVSIVVAFLMAGITLNLGADVIRPEVRAIDEFPSAIGFYAGIISGTGMSYQKWTPSFGYQITAGALYLPEGTGFGNLLDYSVGLQFQFPISGDDFSDRLAGQLYIFTGVNHSGYIPWVFSRGDDLDEPGTYSIGSYTPGVTVGAGFGIEVVLFRRFSIPFELGYAASVYPLQLDDPVNAFAVRIAPQGGFRYRY